MPKRLTITAFGETKSAEEWARDSRCSVSGECIRKRLRAGWWPWDAICIPSKNLPRHPVGARG